jgi:hypothetical protein
MTTRQGAAGRGSPDRRLYKVWMGMRWRCRCHPDYAGRGIEVCRRWEADFTAFKRWSLAHGYRPGLSIDRRNNDGNYTPRNCRWATQKEQTRNTRRNLWVTAFGETRCVTDWFSPPIPAAPSVKAT